MLRNVGRTRDKAPLDCADAPREQARVADAADVDRPNIAVSDDVDETVEVAGQHIEQGGVPTRPGPAPGASSRMSTVRQYATVRADRRGPSRSTSCTSAVTQSRDFLCPEAGATDQEFHDCELKVINRKTTWQNISYKIFVY